MSKPNSEINPRVPTLLFLLGVLHALLSLYLWMELVVVRNGGRAVCALNETVDCQKVWDSAFATRIHGTFGLPIAALGLVWGATALGLAVLLVDRMLAGGSSKGAVAGLKLWSLVGVLSCVTFAVASFKTGALCIVCVLTYVVVVAFAYVALKMLPGAFPPDLAELKVGLVPVLAIAVPCYLALLYPGTQTPSAKSAALTNRLAIEKPTASQGEVEKKVAEFLKGVPWAEQQAVSDSLAVYKHSATPDLSRFKQRNRWGPPDAPMKIVEFTDILCGHCRALNEVLGQLERVVPAGKFSVEARSFPLDGSCNKVISRSEPGTGEVRCVGAKAQACLEGAPDFWELRRKLFEAQESLTREKVLQIASSGTVPREKLEACIADPATQRLLDEDIAYAMHFNPDGTPLVLVNGREGTPSGAWLWAMAMLGGDAESPAFFGLPPPRERRHEHPH